MRVLGISAYRPDSAAALVVDGCIVAAVQEERFSRRKNDAGFPTQAVAYCLAEAGGSVDALALADPEGETPSWPADLPAPRRIDRLQALAAAAFLPSPFARAAILIQDECGFGRLTAAGHGAGDRIAVTAAQPHGIAPLYSAATRLAGFRVDTGEFKLMGLAPYGRPTLRAEIENAGAFPANPELGAARLGALLGIPHGDGATLLDAHMDLAASVQAIADDVLVRAVDACCGDETRICLGGRFALNCVANGRLIQRRPDLDIWVQPAAGTAGAALGAAMLVAAEAGALRRNGDAMAGARLGPSFGQAEAERRLRAAGARFSVLAEADLIEAVAAALADGRVVGWVQGRMEFGPRALGGRSILADPRGAAVQRLLNVAVKRREPFRPFAPVVPTAHAAAWFGCDRPSPYMTLTFPVPPAMRERIPAVTHVDGSARVQTASEAEDPLLSALLAAFGRRTGCPVLVNTSFNVRGEPLVNTPEEAFRCFMGGEMDLLAVDGCLVRKADQDPALAIAHGLGWTD